MDIRFDPIEPPLGERYWQPFPTHDGFTSDWWSGFAFDGSTYLRVLMDNEEVARIHLDDEMEVDDYLDVPVSSSPFLEIQFIEVHADHRRRGVATAAVTLLNEHFPGRPLAAFSEGADDFWTSLGWTRHQHRDDDGVAPPHRPLYVQPPRS